MKRKKITSEEERRTVIISILDSWKKAKDDFFNRLFIY